MYTKKEILSELKKWGYNHSYENCYYTGKSLNVIFLGDWSKGIFTVFKGDLKSLRAFYKKELNKKLYK